MYPLKFNNLYYEKTWGAESWDIACHPNGISIIENGKYKGMRLDKLIDLKGEPLLGSKISNRKFPLLVKILNTNDKLSVQVHPDDEYAEKHEGEMGKTEAWYVMEAEEGSYIILGTSGCSENEFKQSLKDGNVEDCMNKIEVKKGDVYYLKSGLIHSMGPGLTIAEIQQNSDVTYRVYDYNRDRKLHIKKALDIMNFNLKAKRSVGIKIEHDNYIKTYHCLNKHFSLEVYDVKTSFQEISDEERFFIFTAVEGDGLIRYDGGKENIHRGNSVLIPATLGKYEISGKLKLLKSYVPSISKVENEILDLIK